MSAPRFLPGDVVRHAWPGYPGYFEVIDHLGEGLVRLSPPSGETLTSSASLLTLVRRPEAKPEPARFLPGDVVRNGVNGAEARVAAVLPPLVEVEIPGLAGRHQWRHADLTLVRRPEAKPKPAKPERPVRVGDEVVYPASGARLRVGNTSAWRDAAKAGWTHADGAPIATEEAPEPAARATEPPGGAARGCNPDRSRSPDPPEGWPSRPLHSPMCTDLSMSARPPEPSLPHVEDLARALFDEDAEVHAFIRSVADCSVPVTETRWNVALGREETVSAGGVADARPWAAHRRLRDTAWDRNELGARTRCLILAARVLDRLRGLR